MECDDALQSFNGSTQDVPPDDLGSIIDASIETASSHLDASQSCGESTDAASSHLEASKNDAGTISHIRNPTTDNGEFTLIRCDHDPPVKNAMFLLSAPNSLWLVGYDWANASPCELKISFR